jgi:hypothetical protein
MSISYGVRGKGEARGSEAELGIGRREQGQRGLVQVVPGTEPGIGIHGTSKVPGINVPGADRIDGIGIKVFDHLKVLHSSTPPPMTAAARRSAGLMR